jgi:DMSO/TMAO reductase YedYZ molybdopterin-dependent catalytic subunit
MGERPEDPLSRRGFLQRSGASAIAAAVGAPIVFGDRLPAGVRPVVLEGGQDPRPLDGKRGLRVLNDRPINAETPAHLLDDDVTPAQRLFVRNNGTPPAAADVDPATWTLEVGGESVVEAATFTLAALKQRFASYTYQLTIECAGNGRAEFSPPATGNQWTTGAVGCPRWTGVRLRDVLEACGVRDDAVYLGYYGADTHLSGDPNKDPISRGVPMKKALEDETLLAYAMNGADLPLLNGHPLRLVCGGWPASTSGKWLKRIVVRDRVHDGVKMTGKAYRVPKRPVAPGSKVPDDDMRIIEAMPVKSLVTFPKSGATLATGASHEVRGHAWVGDGRVTGVQVSIDFGSTWQPAELDDPPNRLAWQRWRAAIRLPQDGYYEVWARATDDQGRSQPMVVPGWNPKGYLNNACHRVAVLAQS